MGSTWHLARSMRSAASSVWVLEHLGFLECHVRSRFKKRTCPKAPAAGQFVRHSCGKVRNHIGGNRTNTRWSTGRIEADIENVRFGGGDSSPAVFWEYYCAQIVQAKRRFDIRLTVRVERMHCRFFELFEFRKILVRSCTLVRTIGGSDMAHPRGGHKVSDHRWLGHRPPPWRTQGHR